MRRASLPLKLLAALLGPTLLVFVAFGVLAHAAARRALEDELSDRLCAVAAAAAAQISQDSVALLAPGDEDSRTYRNLRKRLQDLKDATQAARVYLFDADLRARVDTAGTPIGERLYHLDSSRAELRAVERGQPRSSLLFRGQDGRLYKSGFAPVSGGGGFVVGVDGSATLFADLLGLRRTLLIFGSGGVMLVALLGLFLSRRFAKPLRQLTRTARGIGGGDLTAPVPADTLRGGDEVAVLAQTLEAMRAALRSRDERLQMMLAGIAHEVRNPLGGMDLFAGLLRDELGAGASTDLQVASGYAERISREVGHLKAIVSDFLEYARRQRPAAEPVALLPLCREAAESAQADAALPIAVSGPETIVNGDPHQLHRAVLNLLRNAVQAVQPTEGRPTPSVSLTLAEDAAHAIITVRDNGPGIPEDIRPRIFTPFFTTREQGTGLGLAFVHEIVRDHGGTVDVTTGPEGTAFTLRLPRAVTKDHGEHPHH